MEARPTLLGDLILSQKADGAYNFLLRAQMSEAYTPRVLVVVGSNPIISNWRYSSVVEHQKK
ncbi:hypothetical protein [Coleofasciculus sp. FACHB-1120]|uniref:hypothetical protein n=1 Tax=Coleofasciculus sp. FACHB-1120 TaxID=2692783 RepID=UPI001683F4AF|nr:hypothetical protein [Coleofasciculus sp. FACHB-1120]